MKLGKKILLIFMFFLGLFFLAKPTFALQFGLIAPQGLLHQGDNVQFIITIDTQTDVITSTSVGLSYQTQYLQYTSTSPGGSMNSVVTTDLGGGQLSFTGTNNSGFNGQGDFALVNFKIIAQAPGSTTLCTLVPIQPTATPIPPAPPGATATPIPPPGATFTPVPPTKLPLTGSVSSTTSLINLGFIFLASYLVFYIFSKK